MNVYEFGVHGSDVQESGRFKVVGRCYKGPIKVGMVFSEVHPPDEGNVMPASVEVLQIEAYGHSLNELDEGVTARLLLAGLSVVIPDGSVLRGGSP